VKCNIKEGGLFVLKAGQSIPRVPAASCLTLAGLTYQLDFPSCCCGLYAAYCHGSLGIRGLVLSMVVGGGGPLDVEPSSRFLCHWERALEGLTGP
jgi:hypothetical protein